MRFACETFFDITATGIVGHFKSSRVPFRDQFNQLIEDERSWNFSRNQQRNWETITQLIGMRSQIFELSSPEKKDDIWYFEFAVETPGVFGPLEDPFRDLKNDCDTVPMLVELSNKKDLSDVIVTSGDKQNVWFRQLE